MKLNHHLDPLMRISPRSDDIRTHGCFQVSLNFMLKPEGVEDLKQLQEIAVAMTKAAVEVIDAHNKKEDEKCPGQSATESTEATILSKDPLAKSSLTAKLITEP